MQRNLLGPFKLRGGLRENNESAELKVEGGGGGGAENISALDWVWRISIRVQDISSRRSTQTKLLDLTSVWYFRLTRKSQGCFTTSSYREYKPLHLLGLVLIY